MTAKFAFIAAEKADPTSVFPVTKMCRWLRVSTSGFYDYCNAAETAPWLASHLDVNGIDLTGAADLDWAALEAAAADNLKRVRRPGPEDLTAVPELTRMTAWLETKTVWHPKGR